MTGSGCLPGSGSAAPPGTAKPARSTQTPATVLSLWSRRIAPSCLVIGSQGQQALVMEAHRGLGAAQIPVADGRRDLLVLPGNPFALLPVNNLVAAVVRRARPNFEPTFISAAGPGSSW